MTAGELDEMLRARAPGLPPVQIAQGDEGEILGYAAGTTDLVVSVLRGTPGFACAWTRDGRDALTRVLILRSGVTVDARRFAFAEDVDPVETLAGAACVLFPVKDEEAAFANAEVGA